MKILVVSSVFPDAMEELSRDHDVVVALDAPKEEIKQLIRDREVLVARSGVELSAEVLACAPNLELLVRAGSGLDNIDLDYVRERGIELERIPGPGARAVAELAFAFMLSLARQVRRADQLLRKGHWAKHEITGHLLSEKTLGVYGAGNIGSQVGRMGAAWGMRVIACVEHPSAARASSFAEQDMRLTDRDEVLATADFVSVHVPLKDSTRNLIDARAIGSMRPDAFLINLARGGVVDEGALYDALASGRLKGAGVDVHVREGEGKISPLAELPNVLLTPHMGAGTVDSQRQIGQRIVEIIGSHARVRGSS